MHLNVPDYLKYTEMIGEIASRYTWQTILLFDDEYRHRQTKLGFSWGTDASHLGTVMLRDQDHSSFLPAVRQTSGTPFQRPSGNLREVCRKFNRGGCSYGTGCLCDHLCAVCGHRDHGAKDHQSDNALPARPSITLSGIVGVARHNYSMTYDRKQQTTCGREPIAGSSSFPKSDPKDSLYLGINSSSSGKTSQLEGKFGIR